MLRIAVCDDDSEITESIIRFLLPLESKLMDMYRVDEYNDGIELCYDLEHGKKYDLIFLDIMMPGKSGVEVGKLIREVLNDNVTQIVYVSSENSYAMELFQMRPMDFLIKPVTQEKMERIMRIAEKVIDGTRNMYIIEKQGLTVRVPVSRIKYIESNARLLTLHSVDEDHSFYGRLDDVYEELKQFDFVFIHKSYVVNYSYVQYVHSDCVELVDKTVLPVSRNRRSEIRKSCSRKLS